MVYIIFTSMLVAVTVLSVFVPRLPSALLAYGTMWLAKVGGVAPFSTSTMIFWGVATAILVALGVILPQKVVNSRMGVPHMATGAVTGAIIGLISNTMAGVILGAVCGVFFGAMIFSRTRPGMEVMHFPSGKFFNYLAAKGIPMVVSLSMIGAVLSQLIYPYISH